MEEECIPFFVADTAEIQPLFQVQVQASWDFLSQACQKQLPCTAWGLFQVLGVGMLLCLQ